MSYTDVDVARLTEKPHLWRKFQSHFGTLPDGFEIPKPGEEDYARLASNPDLRDKFVSAFGEEAYKAAPGYKPEPASVEPAMPEERRTGKAALWGALSDSYKEGGLGGVKNFLLSKPDPELIQDFFSAKEDDDDTFIGKFKDYGHNKDLALMRGIARMGEGLSYWPEAGLEYMGFKDAAAVPRAVRENFIAAEKEIVAAMTPQAREAIEKSFVKETEGGGYTFGEAAKDPYAWLINGADMAVMMAPGIGLSGRASRMAYAARYSEVMAQSAARKVPQYAAEKEAKRQALKAAMKAGAVAGAIGEGIPAGGMAGSAVNQKLSSLEEKDLIGYEPYVALREQGLSHEAARAEIANDKGFKAMLAVAATTGITGAPLGALVGRFVGGGLKTSSRLGTAAIGVAAEGGQEFIQEGSQQLIQNLAEKPITHIDAWEGVMESALTGALLGGALGGAVGGIAGPGTKQDSDDSPMRSPLVRNSLRNFNAARDNLYNAIGTAKDPNAKITMADVTAAREQYREANLALGEALLASGRLSPEQQKVISQQVEEAKASGVKGLQQDGDVKGTIRTGDEAGPAKADTGGQAEGGAKPAPKEGAKPAEALNSVETVRLAALDKVANADTVTAEELQGLVKDGMAKVLPSGVPMLLPAGRRQRADLSGRVAKAEAAGATEKAQEKPAAKTEPKPEAAKPEAKAPKPAPLAPGYADADILKPGEKPDPVKRELVPGEKEALSEADYQSLELLSAGKPVKPEEMANLVKTGLVASRDGGKSFVIRPAGRRELKAYKETGRQTALERDLQKDVGVTGRTLRLSAEARREGRKARAEAVEASEQIDRIFAETKKAAGPEVSAELDKMAAEEEARLAAEKDKDWDRAKEEVELDEYERLTVMFDEEERSSLRGQIRGILKQVDTAARRREAAAAGRLKKLLDERKAFDLGGALVEGSKAWKEIVEIGAMKLIQGIVRIPDWNAAMQQSLKKQWAQVAPHLDKILPQSRALAKNPLGLLEIKHKKANSKTTRLRGQPEGRGIKTLRAQMAALLVEGEPYRLWYEQSSKAILKVAGGDVEKARKLAGLLAIYSSGTAVGANTGNAMKAWYQWVDGKTDIFAGRLSSQDRDAEVWLRDGIFPVGSKRSNFYVNLMREIDPAEFDGFQGGTVDLWMMRAFGYHAEAPGDAQYAFVATEMQRFAQELGWEPQQVQAAIWVAAKARYEETEGAAKAEAARRGYVRFEPGPRGTKKMIMLNLKRYNRLRRDYALKGLFKKDATDRAGSDFANELDKRMAQVNWESKPGVASGVLSGIHSETNTARIAEYHAAIARALQDESGNDIIARRLGILSLGQINGPSAWFYNRDDFFRFTHFSKRLKDDYVTLDIEKFGTGVAMSPQEQSRGPRIFLYPENPEVVESAMTGATEYTVEVLKDDMYDFTADPMGLRKGKSFDAAEDAIRLAGFRGYFVSDHADAMLRGQARLFYSHPAVRADVAKTFRGYVGSGSAERMAVPRLHGNSGDKKNPQVETAAAKKLDAYSSILGSLLKQDAVSWFAPFYTDDVGSSNGVDVDLGRPLDRFEVEALYKETVALVSARGITKDSVVHTFAPIQHATGAYFLNFTGFEADEQNQIPNVDFHGIIRQALENVFSGNGYLSKQDVPDIEFTRFASYGNLIENDWKGNRNGEDYRRRAEEAGEGAAFEWAHDLLAPKIAAINKDFGERYGWTRAPRPEEGSALTRRLSGLPDAVKGPGGVMTPVGPSVKVRLIAQAYMRAAGLKYNPPQDYAQVDAELAARIAAAYEALKHDPRDPEVKASYDAFIEETLAQWEWVKKSGLKVEVIPVGAPDPYGGNPRGAIRDIVENNHFWLFPTAGGLGNEIHGDTPKDHPILRKTGEKIGYHELLANDVFRIVHDYFGHVKEGVGFRATGEYNAWRQHAAMYSPLARRAMSAETLGQNSWMNYGPFGERNRTASVEDSIFAEQKAALLPEEFTSDEAVRFIPAEGTGPGMTVAEVSDAIADIMRATGVPVRVVATQTDLPKHIQDWARARGITPAGVFAQRQQAMYLIADQIKSAPEAVETYAHEVVGHFGLRGVLGKAFIPTMKQLAKSFPVQLAQAAKAHEVELSGKGLSPAQIENNTLLAAEEMVAHAAGLLFRGTGKLPPRNAFRRIIDFVRGKMLQVGWLKTWNQNDVHALIARSNDFARSGRARRQWAQRDYEARMGKKPGLGKETPFSGDSNVKVNVRPGSGFEAWFKGSKAVRPDGSPRVFYHGTDRAFWTFQVGARRRGTDGFTARKAGLFFAEDPKHAEDFTGEHGRVMPVFLSVQNPLDLTRGFAGISPDDRMRLEEAMEEEGLSMAYYDAIEPGKEWDAFNIEYGFGEELTKVLQAAGYDGAKLSEEKGGTWVVFSPNQVKSVFNGGEFSLFNDDILANVGDAPIYYSAVARAVEALKISKAKGHQWLGAINNSPGVKPEEVEWLFLGDFLKENETFTKEQVLRYIDANKLEILPQEVKPEYERSGLYTPGITGYKEILFAVEPTGELSDDVEEIAAVSGKLSRLLGSLNSWQDPHWMKRGTIASARVGTLMQGGRKILVVDELQSDLHQTGRDEGYTKPQEVWRLYMKVAGMPRNAQSWDDVDQSRYPRIGDDAFGAPLQGDTSYESREQAEAAAEHLFSGVDEENRKKYPVVAIRDKNAAPIGRDQAPDAPFKNNGWVDLALKRLFRLAVDGGYDSIVFTGGQVHRDRYKLSNVVDGIEYAPDGPDSFRLIGWKDGNNVFDKSVETKELKGFVGKELADRITSDKFEPQTEYRIRYRDEEFGTYHTDWRIESEEEAEARAAQAVEDGLIDVSLESQLSNKGRHLIEGKDLDVGGLGMLGFYDDILPKAVNRLTKKMGGRVDRVTLKSASKLISSDPVFRGEHSSYEAPYYYRYFEAGDYEVNYDRLEVISTATGAVVHEVRDLVKSEALVEAELWARENTRFGQADFVSDMESRTFSVTFRDGRKGKVFPWGDGGRYGHQAEAEVAGIKFVDFMLPGAKHVSGTLDNGVRGNTHLIEDQSLGKYWQLDITPQMQSTVPGGMPMFAPNTGNPLVDSFFSKIGKPHIPFRDRLKNFTTGLGDRLRQNVLDHFHGIARTGDVEGYMAARLSTGSAGLMRAIMEWGHPVWRNGLHGVEGDKGFIDILKPLGADVDTWAAWMVARRADRLLGEGRENLFTQDEIDEVLALGNGRQDFRVAAEEYAEFKKKILDFAEESGIIDPNTRPLWENDDHIPFYRIMEDGLLKGATSGGGIGFVKKQIVQLKGGTQNLGDPIENILRNWASLVEASLQAKASRTVVDNLNGSGLVVKIDQPVLTNQLNAQALQQLLTQAQIAPGTLSPASQMGLLALSQPAANKDGVITVWRNGKRERWQIHDPMLFKSMQSITPDVWSSWMNVLRIPKRVLTKTITVVPLFIIRNFWRDIWSAFTIGTTNKQAIPFIPVVDNLKGAAKMMTRSDSAKELIASGAGFIGTGFNPTDAAAEAVSLAKDVRLGHRFWHSPVLLYHAYMRMSEAAENASRVAIYEAALKAGRSKMESAFEAKDVMDFSLRGSAPIVRFFVETVPFWGARTQGLYKLGRAVAANPVGVMMRGALMTLGALALFARNMDDERYEELTLDQKNLYWHAFDVFQEGDHWRIPKPFEVGTIFGTVPESILDALVARSGEPDAAKQSLKVVSHAFLHALDLKPEIAAVWPMVELALNRDTFRDAPILNQGDRGVLPQEQDAPYVRSTYRMLAHAMPDMAPEALRSPKQLQHLAKGYIGSLQDWVLVGTDHLARMISGEPKPPEKAATEPLFIGGFRSTGPARNTRSLNELYTIAEEASKVQRSIDKLVEMEPTPQTERRIEKLESENEFKLSIQKDFSKAVKEVGKLRKAQREVQLDPVMTPEEKRQEIQEIQKDINDLARDLWELRPGGPIDVETASRLIGAGKNGQAAILRRSGLESTASLVDAMPAKPSKAMSGAFMGLA